MGHWNDKDDWFNRPLSYRHPSSSELWHGERYRQLSWFWDPDQEFLLPERCPNCFKIVPECDLKASAINREISDVRCPHCSEHFTCLLQYTHGDPRNQSVIIHEDGWSPHSTSARHSIAAITVTHGCMIKGARSDTNNARVYSFVPVSQLPHDSPHKYDAFFKPLVEDIENLFLYGEVFFKGEVEGYSPPNDFHVLPLLVTADSKAHAEIGLATGGGHKGCHRCTLSGTYISERRHYYYGNFRYRF